MQIITKLIKYNFTANANKPIYIVIHDTSNKSRGADAEAHYRYFNGGNRYASAHYFVDDKRILQFIKDNDSAWHCGDGKGKYGITNRNSIGIELCVNSDGDYAKALAKVIELVKYLMKKYNIPVSKVVRHYDASRKMCPASMSANGWAEWNAFKKKLTEAPITNPYHGVGTVTASALNVRAGIGTSHAIKGVLYKGQSVELVEKVEEWYKVVYKGQMCYIHGNYIKVVKAPTKPKPTPPKTPLYRVRKSWSDVKSQIGAYKDLNNAKELVDKNEGYSVFDESGKVVYTKPKVTPPKPVEPKVSIMGNSAVSPEIMATFLLKTNSQPKIQMNVLEFCRAFVNEGKAEGVRGDIAFCQAIHETGFFKFEGEVPYTNNNYSGIGATGGVEGTKFETPVMGIRAQIQHLKAYASKAPLSNSCIDPRFKYVARGIAPNWTDLNGRWAVPGTTYGQKVLEVFDRLKSTKVDAELLKKYEPEKEVPVKPVEPPKTEEDVKGKALEELKELGLIEDVKKFEEVLDKPLPTWVVLELIVKILKDK